MMKLPSTRVIILIRRQNELDFPTREMDEYVKYQEGRVEMVKSLNTLIPHKPKSNLPILRILIHEMQKGVMLELSIS